MYRPALGPDAAQRDDGRDCTLRLVQLVGGGFEGVQAGEGRVGYGPGGGFGVVMVRGGGGGLALVLGEDLVWGGGEGVDDEGRVAGEGGAEERGEQEFADTGDRQRFGQGFAGGVSGNR